MDSANFQRYGLLLDLLVDLVLAELAADELGVTDNAQGATAVQATTQVTA